MSEDLRRRLRAAAGSPSHPADLDAISRRAAQLQARRRSLGLAVGAALLVVAVAAGAVAVSARRGPSRRSTRVATSPGLAPVSSTVPFTTSTTMTVLVPADAASPAAGGCAAAAGPTVLVTLSPDVPQPRCTKVLGGQRLSVQNPTSKALTVSLGRQTVTVDPGGTAEFQKSFGDDLAPGVHRVKVSGLYAGSGPEIWLQDASVSPIPADSLAAYVAAQKLAVRTRTGPVKVAAGGPLLAVVGVAPPATNQVLVLRMAGDGTWGTAARLAGDPRDEVWTFPIGTADVTGDGRTDFVVSLRGGSATPGWVVSDDGGAWRLVPDEKGNIVFARDPRFEGSHLVTTYDDCNPNCAQGHNTNYTWTYDRGTGRFRSASPTP